MTNVVQEIGFTTVELSPITIRGRGVTLSGNTKASHTDFRGIQKIALTAARTAVVDVIANIGLTAIQRISVTIEEEEIALPHLALAGLTRSPGMLEFAARLAITAMIDIGRLIALATVEPVGIAIREVAITRVHSANAVNTALSRFFELTTRVTRTAIEGIGIQIGFTTVANVSIAISETGQTAFGRQTETIDASRASVFEFANRTATATIEHIVPKIGFTPIHGDIVAVVEIDLAFNKLALTGVALTDTIDVIAGRTANATVVGIVREKLLASIPIEPIAIRPTGQTLGHSANTQFTNRRSVRELTGSPASSATLDIIVQIRLTPVTLITVAILRSGLALIDLHTEAVDTRAGGILELANMTAFETIVDVRRKIDLTAVLAQTIAILETQFALRNPALASHARDFGIGKLADMTATTAVVGVGQEIESLVRHATAVVVHPITNLHATVRRDAGIFATRNGRIDVLEIVETLNHEAIAVVAFGRRVREETLDATSAAVLLVGEEIIPLVDQLVAVIVATVASLELGHAVLTFTLGRILTFAFGGILAFTLGGVLTLAFGRLFTLAFVRTTAGITTGNDGTREIERAVAGILTDPATTVAREALVARLASIVALAIETTDLSLVATASLDDRRLGLRILLATSDHRRHERTVEGHHEPAPDHRHGILPHLTPPAVTDSHLALTH